MNLASIRCLAWSATIVCTIALHGQQPVGRIGGGNRFNINIYNGAQLSTNAASSTPNLGKRYGSRFTPRAPGGFGGSGSSVLGSSGATSGSYSGSRTGRGTTGSGVTGSTLGSSRGTGNKYGTGSYGAGIYGSAYGSSRSAGGFQGYSSASSNGAFRSSSSGTSRPLIPAPPTLLGNRGMGTTSDSFR